MNTIVTENNSDGKNGNLNNGRWTPFREGLIFKEFIATWKEGDYEVDENLINKVSDEASEILSKCIDPKKNDLQKNNSAGLVIGQVQSGKTLSMTAVSAMAKDNGFGIVIVLSGNVTSLSSQTAERFEEALDGRNTIKLKNNPSENWSPQDHLLKARAVLENFKNTKNPEDRLTLLIIAHKNPARVDDVAELFESVGTLKDDVPTLIIDDEADHHSLNSKEYLNDIDSLTERRRRRIREIHQISEGETFESIAENFDTTVEELKEINNIEDLPKPGSYILTEYIQTVTHASINDLKSTFKFNTYLGYTATPQAISLIPRVNELSPDFAHVINTGENYTGLDFFFPALENKNNICSKHIQNIEEEGEYHDLISDGQIPPSLEKAINFFIFGVAIGILNKEHGNKKKNRSMIVHPHHLIAKHKDFHDFTIGILNSIKQGLKNKDDGAYASTAKKLNEDYELFKTKFDENKYPDFNDSFIELIKDAVEKVYPNTIIFNARGGKIPHQNWTEAYARILIGGVGLERGYTIKGLTVSYLSRDRARQDDTLLQRARFFGYHKAYNEFVRVFLSRNSQEYYKEISEINTNFISSVKKFQNTSKSFKEWPREWWGTNAADHELTRKGIMRDITLKRFRGDKQIVNKWSHLLSPDLLNENRKIYNDLYDQSLSNLKQISQMDILKNSYQQWCGNRNIMISDKFSIKEIYENYFSKLNFHENEKTNFEVVVQNLATYSRKFPDRPFPILFMYINDNDNENTRRKQTQNGSIQPWIGRDKYGRDNFPGDAILHYDYLIGATEENVGLDNLTLKINLFNEIRDRQNNVIKNDVPYFHFVPSVRIWKEYIKGVYK